MFFSRNGGPLEGRGERGGGKNARTYGVPTQGMLLVCEEDLPRSGREHDFVSARVVLVVAPGCLRYAGA